MDAALENLERQKVVQLTKISKQLAEINKTLKQINKPYFNGMDRKPAENSDC